MTPSARYSDIVLPADMSWEREDIGWNDDDDEIMLFASKAVTPPGEVQSIHMLTRDLAKKLDALGTGYAGDSLYDRITFKDQSWSGSKNMSESDILRYMWDRGNPPYSFEDLKRRGIINVNKEGAELVENQAAYARIIADQPVRPASDFTAVAETGINRSGKFHAYALNIVNEFATRGMVYDNVAYVPATLADEEGDPIAFPIAMYIPLEQGYIEAGLNYNLSPSAGAQRTLVLLSTHDRFRSHSTHNENAWLRDLYKMEPTTDGTTKLARDYNNYANIPADPGKFQTELPTVPRLGGTGLAPLYINPRDADLRSIKNGQKIKVSNEIGAVYACAYLTEKIIPGVVILYQGSWFDPETDGTDAGGNPNTLTPDIPSYVDNGNAQNAIPVQISAVN